MPQTLSFLFTDIEGSTLLWERYPEAMRAALARHDAIMRARIEAHGGRVFKTAGDAFYAVFESASLAVDAARDAQRALLDEEWPSGAPIRVRMAVSTGDAEARDGDYYGPALNVASRLLSATRGGQTLVSEPAAKALAGTARIHSLGHYRLKGVEDPVEVFELVVAEARSPPADNAQFYRVVRAHDAWQPARAIKHNLPVERDEFVGRGRELRDLAQRLDDGASLVTMLGPGGIGKTRLVRRYARAWLGDWPGGVYFCDLSETRSLDGIFFALAVALDVRLWKADPGEQLGHAIAGRGRCLVILDNFEQVVRHATQTVGKWLDRTRDAAFLVTSRERLEVAGEEIFRLEPLPPDNDGVALFETRARAQRPDFVVSESNRQAVAEVVRLVDGLPLAIELAAARVRVLSPAGLVERMRDRFKLLARAPNARARQATLEAAIDWSWNLLTTWEQAALAHCSVFEGGFTLEAAEAVIDLAPWPEAPPAIDVVQALADKSLLRVWVPESLRRYDLDEPYFGMYLSIHEYAAHKLDVMAATRAAQERHCRYFAGFGGATALSALSRHGGVKRRRALALEIDNLMAACRRAVVHADGETAAAACRAAWEILEMQGPFAAGEALATQVLAIPALPAASRAATLVVRGSASAKSGDLAKAETLLVKALELARASGDRSAEAITLGGLADVYRELGRTDEAYAHLETALAMHREAGDRVREGVILVNLGNLLDEQQRVAEARHCYEAALAIAREVGDRHNEGVVLGNLAIVHRDQGEMSESLRDYQAAIAINREVGDRRSEGIQLGNLGNLHADQGRTEEARAHYEAALAIHRELGHRIVEGYALVNLGLLAGQSDRFDEASHLMEQALAIAREVGNRRFEGMVLDALANVGERTGRLDEARAHLESALAIHRAVGNLREEGSNLGSLGSVLAQQGRTEEGLRLLGEGEAKLRQAHNPRELAVLLCTRGELEARVGNVGAARAALAEAKDLAAQLAGSDDSFVGRAVAKLRAILSG